MAEIRLILWVYLRAFLNGLTRGEPMARLRNGGLIALRLVAFLFVYMIMRVAFFGMASISGREYVLVEVILTSLIHVLGAVMLLGAIKYAYQVFYLSEDIEWLLASPIPPTRIFFSKFMENWIYSGQIVFSIGWPLCLAYGAYTEATPAYYVVSLAATALLASYVSSLGVMVCLPLMRYVAKKRLRELLLTLSMGLSVGLYIVLRQMGAAFEGTTTGHSPIWLPTTQLAELIKAAAAGNWGEAVLPGTAFVVPAFALAAAAHILAQHFYLQGIQRKTEEEELVRVGRGEGLLYRIASVMPADIRAVALKDALETIRNPRQWFYLLFAFIFLGFQVFEPISGSGAGGNLFMLVFLASVFSQELTVLGVAREAEMFPIIAAAGIPAWRFYIAKWINGFIPTALFGVIGALVMGHIQGEFGWNVISDIAMVIIGIVAVVSYSVMVGCLFPNFKAYRTRMRLSPFVVVVNIFFTAVLIGLVLFPLGLLRQEGAGGFPVWMVWGLIVFPIVVAGLLFTISFAVGSVRLRQLLRDVPEGVG